MVHSECLIPILISGSLMLYDFISCYMVHLSNLFLFSLLVRSFVYESITRGCLILIICFSVIDMVHSEDVILSPFVVLELAKLHVLGQCSCCDKDSNTENQGRYDTC
jgi:hypothetical protein